MKKPTLQSKSLRSKTLQFKAKIQGKEAGVVAAIVPPIDVPEFFGTRARVPIRGTINGYRFRSSVMPMGGRHMMPVIHAQEGNGWGHCGREARRDADASPFEDHGNFGDWRKVDGMTLSLARAAD